MKYLMLLFTKLFVCSLALANQAESNLNSCLENANLYSLASDIERARFDCLADHKDSISLNMCMKIADSMFFGSSQDRVRNECLKLTSNLSECIGVSKYMIYMSSRDWSYSKCRELEDIRIRKTKQETRFEFQLPSWINDLKYSLPEF